MNCTGNDNLTFDLSPSCGLHSHLAVCCFQSLFVHCLEADIILYVMSIHLLSFQLMHGRPRFLCSVRECSAWFAVLESSIRCTVHDQTSLLVSSWLYSPTYLALIVLFLTLSFQVTFNSFLKQLWIVMEGFQAFTVCFHHRPRLCTVQ